MTLKSIALSLSLAWTPFGFIAYAPAFRSLPEISRQVREAPVFGVIEVELTRVLVRAHTIREAK